MGSPSAARWTLWFTPAAAISVAALVDRFASLTWLWVTGGLVLEGAFLRVFWQDRKVRRHVFFWLNGIGLMVVIRLWTHFDPAARLFLVVGYILLAVLCVKVGGLPIR